MTHKIGDIVNDMKILDSYRNENGNTVFKCICMVCGKNKDIRKYVMDNNPGSTSHKYCDYHCTAYYICDRTSSYHKYFILGGLHNDGEQYYNLSQGGN